MAVGGWIYSSGTNPPVSTTLSSGVSIGGTTVPITSATGLPTITAGSFGTARIQAEGANTSENICYTRSGSTLTLVAPGPTALASAHASGATIDFDVVSPQALDQFKDDAFGAVTNALSGAGALTIGSGTINVCTFTSASATVTLANGSFVGQVCRIRIDPSSTKLVTVDPASSTTIDGATTRIMWAGEAATLQWNGTEWNKIAGKSIPMIAAAYLSSNTANTVNGSVDTQILVDTSLFDNTGLMVNIGANKITLQRPGNYLASCSLAIGFATAIGIARAKVKKGATLVVEALGNAPTGSSGALAGSMPFTGAAGDDMKFYYSSNSGATDPVVAGASGEPYTSFSIVETLSW